MHHAHIHSLIAAAITGTAMRARTDGSRHGWRSRTSARRIAHPIVGGVSR
jgi:hypothetical protein